jgi:hypothetical protein
MISIKGYFDGRAIVPDDPLDLPQNQRVVGQIEPVQPRDKARSLSVLDWIDDKAVDDPSLPTDLSYQHDHYLYGTPKKP